MVFNLKKEWFLKIKSGLKTSEFREYKPYWKRIEKLNTGDKLIFKMGYPKNTDKNKIINKTFIKYNIIDGIDTDLKINKKVYKIDFK